MGNEKPKTIYLHEGKATAGLSGFDEYRWFAYGAVDTYHDCGNQDMPSKFSIAYYEQEKRIGGLFTDPLAAGTLDPDLPIWNPRQYFLSILEGWISSVGDEWWATTHHVQAWVDANVSVDEQVPV
jgi:hypothetical protein